MQHLFTFKKNYFILTILLLAIEILLAIYVHDKFIRPYVGDVLVVILLYCFIKSFLNISVSAAALAVLLFSYTVELLQYAHFVEKVGLQHSNLARIIMGTSFSWLDLVAYTVGILVVLGVEKWIAYSKL